MHVAKGGKVAMQRRDWLLALLLAPGVSEEPSERMSRLRIMKALFLLSQENEEPLAEFYEFEPYLYGPISFDVYSDLRELQLEGLVLEQRAIGRTWDYYRLTPAGEEAARTVVEEEVSPATYRKLREIKSHVNSLNFMGLLRYVYTKYPKFAAESVFKIG